MGKSSKILGTVLLILGIACIGMYFFIGDSFSNYKVIFDSDGGTSVSEQVIKKGEKVVKPADPTKENNEFVEWRLDGVAYNFDTIVSKNMTLKAAWNLIINYNVKVTIDEQEYTASIREGNNLTLEDLQIPPKEGYLVRLYNEEEVEYDLSNPVTADLNLTGKYIEIKTYTVKFNSNGGTKVDDIKVEEGKTVLEPTSTKDGYILDGWYLGEEKFNFQTPISKDITLKARWNDGPRINVIFIVDGTVYKTVPTKENTTVTKPSNPTKKGYRFVKWQLNGTDFDFKTKITSEITLNALFEEATSYKVTFNTDGGSSVKSQEVTDKVTKPGNPTKSGWIFVRWELNGKEFDFNTSISSDITLKAIWEKAKPKYTVRFNDEDGTEIATQTVEEGQKATKPTDPRRENYTFSGWLYNNSLFNFDTPINQNMVLTAHYEKNEASAQPDVPTGDITSE